MAGDSLCRYDYRREKRVRVARPESAKGVSAAAPRPSQTQGVPPGSEKGAGAGGGVVRIAVSEHVLHGSALERLDLARELQADGVELRFGPYDFEQHPLWLPGGPKTLRAQAQAAGLALPSVYGGYFQQFPLSAADPAARRRHGQVLDRLLDACAEAGVAVLVLPLLGAGELPRDRASDLVVEALTPVTHRALTNNLTLALETILPASELQAFLARVGCPAVRVAYDVGNAAVLGYDALADCQLLGEALGQIRVKDCSPQGLRVPLGRGIVPLAALVQALAQRSFAGWWVLETSASEEAAALARADAEVLRRLLS